MSQSARKRRAAQHQFAANSAQRELTGNATPNIFDISRAREELLGVLGGLDAGRPTAWGQYGYKTTLTFADFLQAYERGGAGHGAVHRLLDKCWQERPRIKQPKADKATPWEEGVGKVLDGINAWQKLRDFDRRNMVGRFSALIYRVADGKALREPLALATRLVDVIPVYEDQMKVSAWDSDQASESFGRPTMWQYRMRPANAGDTQGRPDQWVDVHPSRVQLLAEGCVGDAFFEGVPLLKAGFNALVDIEKISGGSGESFLKNSARVMSFEYETGASPQVVQGEGGSTMTVREVHEEQTRKLNRNQDSAIVMQGGVAKTLQTTISDPTGAFHLAANLFSASVQIPFTVLFGQQTGRLASDEDKADMIARCKSRQINELTPMLTQFVRRMQAAGLIEAGEFVIEWPPPDAPGDIDKADLLGKMTASMKAAFDAGISEPLFDANELRGVMDFEAREDDGMPQEGDDPALDPDADPAAEPGRKPPPTAKPALRAAA